MDSLSYDIEYNKTITTILIFVGTFSSDSPADDMARDQLSTTNSSPEELDEPRQGKKRTSKEAEVDTDFPVLDAGFDDFPRYPSYETLEPYESTGYETVGQHLSDYSSHFRMTIH
jgi:hypothetical protein